ncbi:SAF domain-containing protein [Streptacidiphilus rugosus]|uniref:SAF domain-containing protein n=1 Tax=Streptacidiphilus rugosus TaxID=405783 RepID=UPI000564A16F|nr:SAF domain-containing protein [Streptacidiphilus rugosus]
MVTKPRTAPDSGVLPVPGLPDAPRRARRPVLMAAGLALAAVGGLGAYAMVSQAGDRMPVLALAHAVPKGQVIGRSDLAVAQVAPDPALAPIAVADDGEVLGKQAAMDLPAGSLITLASVTSKAPSSAGKTVVGVLAKPGQVPAGLLQPGDSVTVVETPAAGATKVSPVPETVTAVVVSVVGPDANGALVVNLATDAGSAPQLAEWAALGQVAITVQGH